MKINWTIVTVSAIVIWSLVGSYIYLSKSKQNAKLSAQEICIKEGKSWVFGNCVNPIIKKK